MPRIPSQSLQAGGTPRLVAGSFQPVQDQTGRQLQQFGRSMEFAGGGLTRLGDQIQLEHNVARAKEAVAQQRAFEQGMLSPVDGFRSKVGKDAMDAYESSMQALKDRRDSIAAGLQNDEQREVFLRSTESDLLRAQGAMETHMARESKSYNLGQTKALIDLEIGGYRDAQGDPMAAALHMGRLKASVDEYAESAGFSPEQRELLMQQSVDAAHSGALDALLQEDDTEGARAYLNQHGSEMGSDLRARAKSLVTKADRLDKTLRISDRLVSSHEDLNSVLDKARAMFERGEISAELRQDIERRSESVIKLRRSEAAITERETLSEATEMVTSGMPLTPQMRQRLEETGQAWKFDEWQRRGGAEWPLTDRGFRILSTIDDAELLTFASRDEVFQEFRADMDDRSLQHLISKWERARGNLIAASERAASGGGKESYSLSDNDMAMLLFREQEGIPDDLAGVTGSNSLYAARYDRFRHDLFEEARRIGNGQRSTEILRQAYENLRGQTRVVDGEDRTVAGMSREEFHRSQIRTPTGSLLDTNKISQREIEAAEERMTASNRQLIAQGREPIPLTDENVAAQVEATRKETDQKAKVERTDERAQAWARLGSSILRYRNDPEFIKEWKVYGPGGELRQRVTEPKRDFFGFERKGWAPVSYTIPYWGSEESKFEDMVMKRVGKQLGEDFGIDDEDVRAQIRQMLKMSDQAVRGVYEVEKARDKGFGGALHGMGALQEGLRRMRQR